MVAHEAHDEVSRLGRDDRKTARWGVLEDILVGRDDAVLTAKLQVDQRLSSNGERIRVRDTDDLGCREGEILESGRHGCVGWGV